MATEKTDILIMIVEATLPRPASWVEKSCMAPQNRYMPSGMMRVKKHMSGRSRVVRASMRV